MTSVFKRPALILALLMPVPVLVTGCATAAYNIQEKFGIEKRDILVDRVTGVAKAQAEAKDEFQDALEAFRSVVAVDGGAAIPTPDFGASRSSNYAKRSANMRR